METDYFALRLTTLVGDLPIPIEVIDSSIQAARQSFESQRRAGVTTSQALDLAEAELLKNISPTLEAASRLTDILVADFEGQPELVRTPHFPRLLQQIMPLLTEPPSRLADAYIVGLVTDYTEKYLRNGI